MLPENTKVLFSEFLGRRIEHITDMTYGELESIINLILVPVYYSSLYYSYKTS